MRLDHLLSKEPMAGLINLSSVRFPGMCPGAVRHRSGTLTIKRIQQDRQYNRRRLSAEWNLESWAIRPSTLLSPEGSVACNALLRTSFRPLCEVRIWARPFLENCTVDASIFVVK